VAREEKGEGVRERLEQVDTLFLLLVLLLELGQAPLLLGRELGLLFLGLCCGLPGDE
jgi:hypothetical protein